MLYEPHLEKLVHLCVDFPLNFWVLGVVSLLYWIVILHFDLVLCHIRCSRHCAEDCQICFQERCSINSNSVSVVHGRVLYLLLHLFA